MVERRKGRSKGGRVARQRNLSGLIFGGVMGLVLMIGIIVLLTYMFNSSGLKGVKFSEESGFYGDNISIEITPDGMLLVRPIEVRYNLNGDDLLGTSMVVDGRIELEAPESGYRVYTITAMACKNDDECTLPQVKNYVLGKNIDEDVTIDIVNINSPQRGLYDYDMGIMVGGRSYDLNSTVEGNGYVGGNYNNRGKEWAREAYVTMFDVNRRLVWDQSAYLEISGGTSASYDVKSMKISLMVDGENGEELKTFRLRSGSQDQFASNIRSSVVSRLAEESGFDGGTSTQRVVVFLNGEYYGIFDMQENFSERNLARKFGLTKEKDVEKSKGSEVTVFERFKLDDEMWKDLDIPENRERLEKVVDMDSYLEYYAIQILLNNTDWPMNNYEAWRYGGVSKTSNEYEDGKIRFLIYDTDLIYYIDGGIEWFEGAIGDIFRFLMEGQYNGVGSHFATVMESDYYRVKFIELLRELVGGPFATENVLKIIDEEAAKIEHQAELFYSAEEYAKWAEGVELMRKAAALREDEIRVDVMEYFGEEL